MKALALLSLSVAVALGMPVLPAGLAENPVLTKEEQSPLLGDLVPLQGHVEVEDPAPQPRLTPKEQLQEQALAENVVEEEVKVEPRAGLGPEVEGQKEQEVQVAPQVEAEPQPQVEAEPEVKAEQPEVEAEQQPEVEAEQPEVKAEQQPEVEAEQQPEVEELTDPDLSKEEQSGADLTETEKSVRVAFLGLNPVDEPPQEEEAPSGDDVQPEITRRSWANPPDDLYENEYDPWPDQEWFPDDYEHLDPTHEPLGDFPTQDEADFLELWETGSIFPEEGSLEGPWAEDYPAYDYGYQVGARRKRRAVKEEGSRPQPGEDNEGPRSCPGVALEGKCYQFFKEPKKAADAEFFCQAEFPGGHLASITSQQVHRELMALMQKENGAYTRTWVGGLRFLDTGRFVWLDGSHWDYADWLSGEPSNTSGVEDCLEILPHGNGKFNDFTCWEPQAFICSYVL